MFLPGQVRDGSGTHIVYWRHSGWNRGALNQKTSSSSFTWNCVSFQKCSLSEKFPSKKFLVRLEVDLEPTLFFVDIQNWAPWSQTTSSSSSTWNWRLLPSPSQLYQIRFVWGFQLHYPEKWIDTFLTNQNRELDMAVISGSDNQLYSTVSDLPAWLILFRLKF